MLEIDKAVFRNNLLLTQQYCDLQLANTDKNHASILRSINPVVDSKPIFDFEFVTDYNYEDIGVGIPERYVFNFHSVWTKHPFDDYDTLITSLFEEQLKIKSTLIVEKYSEFEGEILAVKFDDTVVDGASQGESRGFIDGYDFPPIDTWFYKSTGDNEPVLFAWIPKQFIWLVDEAIAVNVPDMIQWFKKEYPEDHKIIME
ncbi:MAG TPA: hypothetical protein VF690_06200 [Hymenobacter sp.]|jgi:hypothetical protein